MIHRVNTNNSGDEWNSSVFVSKQYEIGTFRYTFKQIFGWCDLGKPNESWSKLFFSLFCWSDCWKENI